MHLRVPRPVLAPASVALAALIATPILSHAAAGWNWYAMPLVTSTSLANGVYPGGEGCQRPQAVAVDPVDARTVLYGTDVGGLFRSTDGGANFSPSNTGLEATGVLGLAFDPMNRDRVLLAADGGDTYNQFAGIYLSTNRGATWTREYSRALNAVVAGSRQNGRDQIAYAKGSYDAGFGHCRTVYWVSEDDITPTTYGGSTLANPGGALYKSLDGGDTWARVAVASLYEGANDADSRIAVHPTSGFVYITNKNGFFRSDDGGVSFAKILTGNFKACEIVTTPGYADHVWIASSTQLLRSLDGGLSFTPITFTGIAGFAR
ncbi:MAG: hypothetical protein H7067_07975, partial [Burkholderiales bacterium]|nr:hypothetical protein [Opitutaceae bacterium]